LQTNRHQRESKDAMADYFKTQLKNLEEQQRKHFARLEDALEALGKQQVLNFY
jgi:hypothetical protein